MILNRPRPGVSSLQTQGKKTSRKPTLTQRVIVYVIRSVVYARSVVSKMVLMATECLHYYCMVSGVT